MNANIVTILFTCLFACPFGIRAQVTPLFQTTFYFEDSLGNRDSVILGYDTVASSQNFNFIFGEEDLILPFDSIFEVRAIHGDDQFMRTSKKVIEHVSIPFFDTCELPFHTKIIIQAKYPPVKILYYGANFPEQSCKNVIVSPEWNIFLLPQWWDVCKYQCLSGGTEYLEDFIVPEPFGICANWLFVEKEVLGKGVQLLPGLFLATFYGPGPCNDSTFVSAGEIATTEMPLPWPNPAVDHFFLKPPDGVRVEAELLDIMGRKMACAITPHEGGLRFDVGALPKGLYLVSVWREDGSGRALRKLVIR